MPSVRIDEDKTKNLGNSLTEPENKPSYENQSTTLISTIDYITTDSDASSSESTFSSTVSINDAHAKITGSSFAVSEITPPYENPPTVTISTINPITTNSDSPSSDNISSPIGSPTLPNTDDHPITTGSSLTTSEVTSSYENQTMVTIPTFNPITADSSEFENDIDDLVIISFKFHFNIFLNMCQHGIDNFQMIFRLSI